VELGEAPAHEHDQDQAEQGEGGGEQVHGGGGRMLTGIELDEGPVEGGVELQGGA